MFYIPLVIIVCSYQWFVKQSANGDCSSLLDVNATSAVPEDHEYPDLKVSSNLERSHNSTECTHSIDHITTDIGQNINYIM